MSDRILLPEHYMTNNIGTMGADEIAHIPSYVIGVDYLSRSLHVDSHFRLSPEEHGDLDLDDEFVSRQKVNSYITIMSLYAMRDHIYVADLRNLDSSQLTWGEFDEASDDADLSRYPYSGHDVNDYNHSVKGNNYYLPLAAAAIFGLTDEIEFLGEGAALDAAKYLYEESNSRKKAFEQYLEQQAEESSELMRENELMARESEELERERIGLEQFIED